MRANSIAVNTRSILLFAKQKIAAANLFNKTKFRQLVQLLTRRNNLKFMKILADIIRSPLDTGGNEKNNERINSTKILKFPLQKNHKEVNTFRSNKVKIRS